MKTTVEIISEITGVSVNDICGLKRDASFVEARQLCIYFYRLDGLTYNSIGYCLNRTHPTCIHGYNKISDLIFVKDKRTLELIKLINEKDRSVFVQ